MNRIASAFLLAALAVCATESFAHKPSDSYLRIERGAERFEAEWDLALRDLELVVGLDADRDGAITWGELKSARERVVAYALSRLTLESPAGRVPLAATDLRVVEHSDGAYAVLSIAADPTTPPAGLELRYALLFDVDPTHRGLVRLTGPTGAVSTHVLDPQRATLRLDGPPPGVLESLASYVREGVWHIWIGLDHVLFLITLLIPAVLRQGGAPRSESIAGCVRRVAGIVTSFTVAHSITLWLAVVGWVSLPSRLVESAIALSIVVTALGVLRPAATPAGWRLAFAFGLVHGFGFAGVLADLGLGAGSLAAALLGFNVGVELGQIAIVIAFVPLAFLMRDTAFYRRAFAPAAALGIAAVAAVWAAERVFDLEVIPL